MSIDLVVYRNQSGEDDIDGDGVNDSEVMCQACIILASRRSK